MTNISDVLINNIVNLYDEKGNDWLLLLPLFLKEMEAKLNIKLEPPFPNLTYNYVAPAVLASGEKAVFKCCVPNKELTSEIAALQHFAGNGIVRLIAANADEGWLLLERIEPGKELSKLDDDDASTIIAVDVMQKLKSQTTVDNVFLTVDFWLEGLQRLKEKFPNGNELFPAKIIDRACAISQELLQSTGNKILLHGDLHHDNILSSNRDSWLAIDPKGVIGEAEFEVAAFMKNPMQRLIAADNLKKLFSRRIDIIVEITGFVRQRILNWSFVVAVLSAWWNFEDDCGEIKSLIYCASVLKNII